MSDESQIDQIERYLMGESTPEEAQAIEERMTVDPDFRAEVEELRGSIEAVRDHHRSLLFQQFAEWDRQIPSDDPTGTRTESGRRWWIIGLACVILCLGAWWFISHRPVPAAPIEVAPAARPDSLDSERRVGPESPDEMKPSIQESRPSDMAAREKTVDRPAAGALFAEYYEPYKDEMLNPEMRGSGPEARIDSFRLAYWDGQYDIAIRLFEDLPLSLRAAATDRFCYAGALLKTGRTDQAIPVFRAIHEDPRAFYRAEAAYAMALAYLAKGEASKSVTWLDAYLEDPMARQADKARQLRSRLQ